MRPGMAMSFDTANLGSGLEIDRTEMRKIELPAKTCAACHRPFVWTKKSARVWNDTHFCSEQCRHAAPLRVGMQCEPVSARGVGVALRLR